MLGEDFVAKRRSGLRENFLHMMFAKKGEDYKVALPLQRRWTAFSLHADHEQNAFTSTVRLAGSTGTNPYSHRRRNCALWGPSHGGANEAVLNMIDEIGSVDNIPEYINKAKDKDDPFRIMGFVIGVQKLRSQSQSNAANLS